jgi:hypothetical protein
MHILIISSLLHLQEKKGMHEGIDWQTLHHSLEEALPKNSNRVQRLTSNTQTSRIEP